MVSKLIPFFIAFMPWSAFLFKQVDIWHAHGHYFQSGLLILYALSFFDKPKEIKILNKPLGIFILWTGLITCYLWISIFTKTNNYPIKIFMPFFNILCFALLYKLSLEYVDSKVIVKTLKYLKISIGIIALYAILQYFKLDQFYVGIGSSGDQVVGTIGNQSQLAGFFAIFLAIFYGSWWLIPMIIAILLTKSISGIAVGLLVWIGFLLYKRKFLLVGFIVTITLFICELYFKSNPGFFSFSHRLSVWHKAWDMIQNNAITGSGLGTFGLANVNGIDNITSHWRHAHNEYLQSWFEIGIVGLGIIIWAIVEYFKNFRLDIKLSLIFLGFCLLSLVSFPSHLWLIAMVGMISYSWLYSLKNEVLNAQNPS